MAGYIRYRSANHPDTTLVANISIYECKLPNSLSCDLWLVEKIEITLTDEEIQYAVDKCGAAPVHSQIASYYGDEAKRIIANWVKTRQTIHR